MCGEILSLDIFVLFPSFQVEEKKEIYGSEVELRPGDVVVVGTLV